MILINQSDGTSIRGFGLCLITVDSVLARSDPEHERHGWEKDVAELVNAALDTHDWTRRKPKVTVDSIRRYLERERLYAKRTMQHFSPTNQ